MSSAGEFVPPVRGVLPHAASAGASMRRADRALALAAQAWFVVAVCGQAMLAAYVLGLYGRSAASGHVEAWNTVTPHGHVPGHPVGNAAFAAHLAGVVVVMLGGGLQFVAALRRAVPAVHRWIGRAYVVAAMATALDGAGLVWLRGTVGDLSQHLAITLDALLILLFGALAWRDARARRFAQHRRWAWRLYLATAGSWFFRVELMAWIALNRGPAGFDPQTFTGPAVTALAFGQLLLPLAVLEAWLRVREHGGAAARAALAAGFVGLTLLTALGVGVAAKVMWLPHL